MQSKRVVAMVALAVPNTFHLVFFSLHLIIHTSVTFLSAFFPHTNEQQPQTITPQRHYDDQHRVIALYLFALAKAPYTIFIFII